MGEAKRRKALGASPRGIRNQALKPAQFNRVLAWIQNRIKEVKARKAAGLR